MIVHILDEVNKKKIILASGSPRRKEILQQIGLKFAVIPSTFDEKSIDKKLFKTPQDFVKFRAQQKAKNILETFEKVNHTHHFNISKKKDENIFMVIGSDTVVVLDEKILERPINKENAFQMLKSLSGRKHMVCTGVALISKKFEIIFCDTTFVEFDEISDEMISAYIETGEPMDKAGSYGVQAIGGSFIKKIDGCFYNVMGFPLHLFCKEILKINQNF